MPRKRLLYEEGTLFAVPLRDDSGYALGIVARLDKKGGILGYFFGKKYPSIPDLVEVTQLISSSAILIRQFGDLGLLNSSWPIVGRYMDWRQEDWPVPAFSRIAVDQSTAWKTVYSDKDGITLLTEQEVPISLAQMLPEDGLSGYGAIELRLTKLLS
jgi:hypothetical protein